MARPGPAWLATVTVFSALLSLHRCSAVVGQTTTDDILLDSPSFHRLSPRRGSPATAQSPCATSDTLFNRCSSTSCETATAGIEASTAMTTATIPGSTPEHTNPMTMSPALAALALLNLPSTLNALTALAPELQQQVSPITTTSSLARAPATPSLVAGPHHAPPAPAPSKPLVFQPTSLNPPQLAPAAYPQLAPPQLAPARTAHAVPTAHATTIAPGMGSSPRLSPAALIPHAAAKSPAATPLRSFSVAEGFSGLPSDTAPSAQPAPALAEASPWSSFDASDEINHEGGALLLDTNASAYVPAAQAASLSIAAPGPDMAAVAGLPGTGASAASLPAAQLANAGSPHYTTDTSTSVSNSSQGGTNVVVSCSAVSGAPEAAPGGLSATCPAACPATVTVTGSASMSLDSDLARVSWTVTKTMDNTTASLKALSADMEQATAQIIALIGADATGLQPDFLVDPDANRAQPAGAAVTSVVPRLVAGAGVRLEAAMNVVLVNDPAAITSVLDLVLHAGIAPASIQLNDVQFELSPTAAQAARDAVQMAANLDATNAAQWLAQMSGLDLAKVLNINMPAVTLITMAATPGSWLLNATVDVTYALSL